MRSTATLAMLTLLPAMLMAQGTPATRSAARTGPTVGLAVDLSFEMGGDDFLEVLFTNGSTQKLRAGQGGTLAVGGIVRPSATSRVSLRGTVGLKYVTTAANNADIMFTRIPLELVGNYDLPNGARFGLGVVHHTSNKFKGDGFVPDVTFEPATGFTTEFGYKAIALTYTVLNYTLAGSPPLDGGSFGVQLLWTPKFKRK